MRILEIPVNTNASSWTSVSDSEGVRTLNVPGFRDFLSFYGRDVNDQNFRDHRFYLSCLVEENDCTECHLQMHFKIPGDHVEPYLKFLGTAIVDEGRRVLYCFWNPLAETGLMKAADKGGVQ